MKEKVTEWCKVHLVDIKENTLYHASLIRNEIRVDIYWVNERYHIVNHHNKDMRQKRGDVGDSEILLESIFL